MTSFVSVCLSVCPSASTDMSQELQNQTSLNFFVHVALSVILWRRCDLLCTSGVVDDVTSSHCLDPMTACRYRSRVTAASCTGSAPATWYWLRPVLEDGGGGNYTGRVLRTMRCRGESVLHHFRVKNNNTCYLLNLCIIGPIPWGHSGPLCHALSSSSSSSWTSMRRRRATRQ